MDPDAFKNYERGLLVMGICFGVLCVVAGFAIWRLIADHVTVH